MRHFFMTFLLASGMALAAHNAEPVTYLKGSIEGIPVNAAAKADLSSLKVLVIETETTRVEIPYAGVSSTEASAPVRLTEYEPLYKVWTIHKRLLPPEPVQSVTLAFRDAQGERNTVTLEMEKPAAELLLQNVREAAEEKAAAANWWGDRVWKTKRNQVKWDGQREAEAAKVAARR